MTKNTGQLKSRRHPIAVILGHIDHGKTTLLDKIRQTGVAAKETGGITQHIGAYEIELEDKEGKKQKITFIDTPGHEAFSKMRSRGAKIADVALLIVAADEGVKPQTEEALHTIEEAIIPSIVVLNKTDKENADVERVKKELGDKGVILEEWGGKIPAVKVSAKTGEGISELLEMILLVSELDDLSCDFSKQASGVVIESHLDPKRGNAATLLLRSGSLEKGNFILAGTSKTKIKILEDFNGKSVSRAEASSPVRVVGFNTIPSVGSVFETFVSEDDLNKSLIQKSEEKISKENVPEDENIKILPVVIKADTAGCLEAIESELKKFNGKGFFIKLLRSQVGGISEDDVRLASGNPESLIAGFRVKAEKSALELAGRLEITVGVFNLIYELADWLKIEIEKRLPSVKEKKVLGKAKVLKIFKRDSRKQIVGGRVEKGKMESGRKIVLLRRDFPLAEGKIIELQLGKVKTREVSEGNDFGALVDLGAEAVEGDRIEVFEEEVKKMAISAAS